MRNNQNLIDQFIEENKQDETTPLKPQNIPENPSGFSFSIPTEEVQLPSRGLLYPENHPLHGVESVEIRHMTAKDEDILTNESYIRKGIVIDKLLQHVMIDRIDVNHFLIGDKNALVHACRLHGYGADYGVENFMCPSCEEKQEYSFNISEWEFKFFDKQKLEENQVELTENKTMVCFLPRTGIRVEFKYLDGRDQLALERKEESDRKRNLRSTSMSNFLRAVIVSVDGHVDLGSIANFIEGLPAMDSRYFRRIYNELQPDVDSMSNFLCKRCGYEEAVEVPLDISFFWPER
jgi:hypothetical protein